MNTRYINRTTTISRPLNMDLRARAELLTYLVASHRLTREMTGEWLSVEHVVESTKLRLSSNGGGADLMQRARPTNQALDIAKRIALTSVTRFDSKTVVRMFCENLRLDFRSNAVRETYQACLNQLVSRRWY